MKTKTRKEKPERKPKAKQTTIEDRKDTKPPKKPKASPSVVLKEAQTEELQVEALDHKITGAKEHLKELKALREGAIARMRTIVREQKQQRMFDQKGNATKEAIVPKGETKPAKDETKTPAGDAKASNGETTKTEPEPNKAA